MIQAMKIQLGYLNLPVYEMVYDIKTKKHLNELSFLSECCGLVKNGYDFPAAWKISLENTSLYYKRDEKDKLLHLGLNLGTSNTESQINMLNFHLLYFNEFLDRAKAQKQKYGTLSMTLSVLSGCMIFILII